MRILRSNAHIPNTFLDFEKLKDLNFVFISFFQKLYKVYYGIFNTYQCKTDLRFCLGFCLIVINVRNENNQSIEFGKSTSIERSSLYHTE